MVRIQIRNDLEPSAEGDDLSLDVLVQYPSYSLAHHLNKVQITHAISRIPTSW